MKLAVAGLAMMIVALSASASSADCCCQDCGCSCQTGKICRLVREKKKVPKVTYTSECEDFCVPGPSKRCGYTCECEDDCTCGLHSHRKTIWEPTCAKVRTRSKLVKKEETKEVDSWKWVVEDLCPKCAANSKQAKQPDQNTLAAGEDQQEVLQPVAEAPDKAQAETQTARLISHNIAAKLKRGLSPGSSK
jgi:hypothetical protein